MQPRAAVLLARLSDPDKGFQIGLSGRLETLAENSCPEPAEGPGHRHDHVDLAATLWCSRDEMAEGQPRADQERHVDELLIRDEFFDDELDLRPPLGLQDAG